MSKYYDDCRESSHPTCTFSTEAGSIEQVVEQLADHVRIHRNRRGFGKELYARMRRHIHRRGDASPVDLSDGVLAQAGD
jgi:hypothetical protein